MHVYKHSKPRNRGKPRPVLKRARPIASLTNDELRYECSRLVKEIKARRVELAVLNQITVVRNIKGVCMLNNSSVSERLEVWLQFRARLERELEGVDPESAEADVLGYMLNNVIQDEVDYLEEELDKQVD